MTIRLQRRMLQARAVIDLSDRDNKLQILATNKLTHFDPIVARSGDDLPTIELQCSYTMVILECFKYTTSPKVPDLLV